jgi:Complex 1 protein (LYR family)
MHGEPGQGREWIQKKMVVLQLQSLSLCPRMLPPVRDLYKRLLLLGVDYPHPEGLAYVRRKVKEGFKANAHLTHEVSAARCSLPAFTHSSMLT